MNNTPSKFWTRISSIDDSLIATHGIENFKRTLSQNYFTWSFDLSQWRWLFKHLSLKDLLYLLFYGKSTYDTQKTIDPQVDMTYIRFKMFSLMTLMVYQYARKIDSDMVLRSVSEPIRGNPFKIYLHDKLISQDLANSTIEYYSMKEHFSFPNDREFEVLEIGAGSGRMAHLLLTLFPNCRYSIIDIEPALTVSKWYLKDNPSDVKFYSPDNAWRIPSKSIDLVINISSFHEMTTRQIYEYSLLIEKVCKGFLYHKQWKKHINAIDGITIERKDYPFHSKFNELYNRECRVQPMFFEAMYKI
jgi:putative sugar O-methyltransferase